MNINLYNLLDKLEAGELTKIRAVQLIQEEIEREIKAGSDEDRLVLIPKDPPLELLKSMAVRYNHAFSMSDGMTDEAILKIRLERPIYNNYLLTSSEKTAILVTMRQLHQEVVGRGFYNMNEIQEKKIDKFLDNFKFPKYQRDFIKNILSGKKINLFRPYRYGKTETERIINKYHKENPPKIEGLKADVIIIDEFEFKE